MTALPHSSRKVEQDDGWIKWAGGECPVSGETLVNWRIVDRSDDDDEWSEQAYNLDWDAEGVNAIIAYRIARP